MHWNTEKNIIFICNNIYTRSNKLSNTETTF